MRLQLSKSLLTKTKINLRCFGWLQARFFWQPQLMKRNWFHNLNRALTMRTNFFNSKLNNCRSLWAISRHHRCTFLYLWFCCTCKCDRTCKTRFLAKTIKNETLLKQGCWKGSQHNGKYIVYLNIKHMLMGLDA